MITFHFGRPGINLFDSKRALFLLVLFLLVLPKGGIKLAGIPVTWGYLLLGLFTGGALLRTSISLQKDRLFAFACLIPFQLICALTMFLNGTESLGMTISFWISCLFLPFAFFFVFSKDIDTFDADTFFTLFKKGIYFIAAYGIALFFLKLLTGRFIEIPLLTTNLGDYGELENKNINRGTVFKLISTYNNGNIYGICLLILLPLYCLLESSKWRKFIVKASLFLTLARTIWIGLIFHEVFCEYALAKNKRAFLLKLTAVLALLVTALIAFALQFNFSWEFFLDRKLGGRSHQLDSFTETGLFSSEVFASIAEIVYAGITYAFGWAGLFAFLLGMCGPLFVLLSRRPTLIQKSIACGLVNYLFISCSDGAILMLPTMAFYWFLSSLACRKGLTDPLNFFR